MKNSWFVVLIVIACSGNNISGQFSPGLEQGVVDLKLEEASGLVASVAHPGYFWAHNDSGNSAELFLIDSNAQIAATLLLANVPNRDWEDITLGAGPEAGKNYLYVGDIGDNRAQFPYKIIYRLEEPAQIESGVINQFDTLYVQLSDGVRDSETLMVDPISSDMFIVSKREDSVRLYQFANTWKSGDTLTAEMKIKIPYFNTVSADISLMVVKYC
ncbi:MAG: putative lipoprotein [Bacteroidetes bacterium OLB12]|nr:MAG: putative lipoprotein [Bacteroidetes bacterium OLB12]